MPVLRLTPLAVSRSRFALSPLAETLAVWMTLARPERPPGLEAWAGPWRARFAPVFAGWLAADPFAAGLVGLVTASRWLPGFLTLPPPDGMRTTLAAELPAVRAWADDAVRRELTETLRQRWVSADLDWLTGRGWADRVADLVERTWTVGIQPDWARRRGVLERDVMYRAGLLAAYGWPRAIERMSRHSAWIGADAIRYSSRPGPDRQVGDEGMMFVPVSLTAGTWLAENDGRDFAVVYAARGLAAAAPAARVGALDRLVGAGRARILRQLERPATSTELAGALGLSLGTVGAHLGVLREAGMVTGARVGRKVVYRRTDAAELVLAAAIGPVGDDVDAVDEASGPATVLG